MSKKIKTRQGLTYDLNKKKTYKFPPNQYGLGDVMQNMTEQSKATTKANFSNGNGASSIGGIASGIGTIAEATMANAQIKDTSQEHAEIDAVQNADLTNTSSYDALLDQYDTFDPLKSNYTKQDVRGVTGGQIAGNIGKATLSGVQAGAAFGPWGAVIGAAVGALGSGIGAIAGGQKAKKEAARLNRQTNLANMAMADNMAAQTSRISEQNMRNMRANIAAYGGLFKDNTFTNGLTFINEGGTHESNPYEGVMVGVDNEGTPNLVEEGEVIWNDYVFSNRLTPKKTLLKEIGLHPKYEDWSFAMIAEDLQKESEERPTDPISKRGLDDSMMKLMTIQESVRESRNKNKYAKGGLLGNLFGGDGPYSNYLRYTPTVANAFALLNNLFEKPDYTLAETMERNAAGIPFVDPKLLDNYIELKALDRNAYLNPIMASSRANARDIQNQSGNTGAVYTGLLANVLNTQDTTGRALLQMEQENQNRAVQEATFNRQTDEYNAGALQQAQARNIAIAQQKAAMGNQAAAVRADIQAARNQAIASNLDAIAEDLGSIGTENYWKDVIDKAPWLLANHRGEYKGSNTGACGGMLTRKKKTNGRK